MRNPKSFEQTEPAQMTQETLEKLYQETLEVAARQLSYRALSVSGLRDKLLSRGYQEDAVEYALAYLQAHGFLDDLKYAESTVRSYRRRGYGTLRIRQELRRRGVESDEASEAMEDYEPDWEAMEALLEKRLHGDLSDRKEVNKAVAALQRRGFMWEDIRTALNRYGASLAEDFD